MINPRSVEAGIYFFSIFFGGVLFFSLSLQMRINNQHWMSVRGKDLSLPINANNHIRLKP
jgi:hypothetical protein